MDNESSIVESLCRCIISRISHLDTLPLIEELERIEPHSTGGMPLVVWAVHLLKPETRELDVELGRYFTDYCMQHGLLMPQIGSGTLKIAPPLCITKPVNMEWIDVIEDSLQKCVP